VVLTVGNFAQSTGTLKVGGWLGLVTAVLAWYASFAGVVNATWKQQVIPVLPLPGPGA
jgi:succinate-acetate transporter protein